MTDIRREPGTGELKIQGYDAIRRVLPEVFGEYRSLFSIHLQRILEIERKHPIYAVALLVAVACETLSRLFGRREEELFANRYLARHGVDEKVGRLIFRALRNGLAHQYKAYPITLRGEKIGLTMTWRDGPHLRVVGRARDGVHWRIMPVRPAQERFICLDVSTMVADLNALLEEVAIELDGDSKMRDEVVQNAKKMFAETGADPQGGGAQAFEEFLRTRELRE
jgi:hypothetical protein